MTNAAKMMLLSNEYTLPANRQDVHAYDMPTRPKLDRSTAKAWVSQMHNADGTTGGYWTMEQTGQVREQYAPNCDPIEFYAAINMIYSDYGQVLHKYGMDKADVYADMAKAFLQDADAVPDKLAAYYHYIVQH